MWDLIKSGGNLTPQETLLTRIESLELSVKYLQQKEEATTLAEEAKELGLGTFTFTNRCRFRATTFEGCGGFTIQPDLQLMRDVVQKAKAAKYDICKGKCK